MVIRANATLLETYSDDIFLLSWRWGVTYGQIPLGRLRWKLLWADLASVSGDRVKGKMSTDDGSAPKDESLSCNLWPFSGFGYEYEGVVRLHTLVSVEFQRELETGTFDSAAGAIGLRRTLCEVLGRKVWQVRCRPHGEGAYRKWTLICFTVHKAVIAECLNVGTQGDDGLWLFAHVRDGGGADVKPPAGHAYETILGSGIRELQAKRGKSQQADRGLFQGPAINVVCRELLRHRARFTPFSYPIFGGYRYVLVELDTLMEISADPSRFPRPPKLKQAERGSSISVDEGRMADVFDALRFGAGHYLLLRHLPGIVALLERRKIQHSIIVERADPDRPMLDTSDEASKRCEALLNELRRKSDHIVITATHEDGSKIEAHLDGPKPETARLLLVRAHLTGVQAPKGAPAGPTSLVAIKPPIPRAPSDPKSFGAAMPSVPRELPGVSRGGQSMDVEIDTQPTNVK